MQAPRRDALNVAKAAVRAYARDPTKANAIEVDVAWRRIRALDGVAPWRAAAKPPKPAAKADRPAAR